MDKKIFIWLQIIANKNSNFNYYIYKNNLNFQIVYDLYYDKMDLKNLDIDESIISCFLDKNIKYEANETYKAIIESKNFIVTVEDYNYPKKILNNKDIPFYYICKKRLNLNNKNVYLYYANYYSSYGTKLLRYFSKIIKNNNSNVISEYFERYIILPNKKYDEIFSLSIIDFIIIIEARYEEKIVRIVDEFLNRGIGVYVVPSNIFNKNSYFSNYLIKQGADIILNEWDIKFILKSIIC